MSIICPCPMCDKAFAVLEVYGVPKERARTVSNGIEVLMQRVNRSDAVFRDMLRQCAPYVKQAHDEAEAKHDNYGEYYMDGGQYEIMQHTQLLLDSIKALG